MDARGKRRNRLLSRGSLVRIQHGSLFWFWNRPLASAPVLLVRGLASMDAAAHTRPVFRIPKQGSAERARCSGESQEERNRLHAASWRSTAYRLERSDLSQKYQST